MSMLSPAMALPSRAMIGRWTVDQYTHVSRWWIVAGAVMVVMTALHIFPGTSLAWNVAVFFVAGVVVARQRGGKTESLTAGAVVGLTVGFVSAAMSLVMDPSVIGVVNIVAETLMTGFIAALITTVGMLLSQLLWRQS